MKRTILTLVVVLTTIMNQAQQNNINSIAQVTVSGEGKIKVTPDEAIITVGVEYTGQDATEVKKKNDETVDQVIKTIKKNGIPVSDFQSQRISLYKNYDYQTKKNNYVASQTISIHLKDLSKYEALMVDLVNSGINQIQGVEFKSSKLKQYETEARKKAVLDAKMKAEDYVVVLGQKIGKAILISDTTQSSFPQPMYRNVMAKSLEMATPNETLAIGEIDVMANVTISFLLQ
ncbi:SIMPL domain-containing protein [Flavobacterium jejuense]|uniref:SIMPL domain-containing protein n=1 Tax=Flavobacterium jejuense TaxID=1544455 RepID=A0ABX0IMS6_9FLAO|nr:SIMPL domain-containing protein [Flavobacterium jejuense]NHN24888.1 SIMPL domain-containing protein [Flavobacterium jejuense]